MKTYIGIGLSTILVACSNGDTGLQGPAGSSCSVLPTSQGATILCTDGTHADVRNGQDGATGPQGPVGPTGPTGQPGLPGTACSVSNNGQATTILCGESSTTFPTSTTVDSIELCPGLPGGLFHEYLLRINGQLYGVYASGQRIGLSQLWPGSWETTDGRHCSFTVHNNLTVSF